MPISDDEWESGKRWNDVERAVAEFLDAVSPRAYSIPELHELLAEGGTVAPPADGGLDGSDEPDQSGGSDESGGPDEINVIPMDVTEREVREAVTELRDAEYLESRRIETGDGVVAHYRRAEFDFLG